MINLKSYLFEKIKPIIENWDEESIYAISFFVHENMINSSIPTFSISYNTEGDCDNASLLSEERWNYAFWRQDEIEIIGDEASTNILLQWYQENNIKDVGYEDEDSMYDEDSEYIGKGPNGYYDLLKVVADVAKELHEQKIIINTFKRELPILIHDLEYAWYIKDITREGNPNGEAQNFIEFLEENF